METPFVIPEFLQGQSVGEIMARMLSVLPDGMDKSEGGFAYDFVMPTAVEKAQMVEFTLLEIMKNMFPLWAYGENLDNLGFIRGIPRKASVAAEGQLLINAIDGTVLPSGSKFSTVSKYGEPSITFQSSEEIILGEESTVNITAETTGMACNTAANTITLASSPIEGILSCTNPLPVGGGADTEDDAAYRQRLVAYDKSQGDLYVGSMADYRRWALAVSGVGGAVVIPANDDTGLVRIVITDTEETPATSELCKRVYNDIMQPDIPYARKAPINALLEVTPPDTLPIEISAKVELDGTASIEEVTAKYIKSLVSYFPTSLLDGEVKYSMVCAILIKTDGVTDYSGLLLSGGVSNIPIPLGTLPVTDSTGVVLSV